ncbi:hypothetical protein F5Y03DRAFT_222034 [Xylaria venustula]|nr:hypothetical protein F5Y03DRAFT_222034 [Xylaria venustula]
MTTATFFHIDINSYTGKPWSKVDGPGKSYKDQGHERDVHNLRGREKDFTTDNSGFAIIHSPAREKVFASDEGVRAGYYDEVRALLLEYLPGKVKQIHIFDHTIRRHKTDSPRQPVQQVHVDQTAAAAIARIRRHLPSEADELLRGRYQIVNAWRPIEYAASDYPLAVVDWRSTEKKDFVSVDLMYPKRADSVHDDDDRGKEKLPDPVTNDTADGYEPRGEHVQVAPNENHQFYYLKDMTPDEVMLLKCYDSYGEGEPGGIKGLAVGTPHTAFYDPNTPKDAPARQSIEVRCLVFYE